MISPHAHIAMTYQPPAPEPKHVHRIEKKQREPRASRTHGISLARRLHLTPRSA